MKRRILAILRARLAAHLGGETIPGAALLAQGSFVAVMSLIARDTLGPWGYTLFALTLSAGIVALTLLGEFGAVLRADPSAEWSRALPSTPFERRAAGSLVILLLVLGLCAGSLLPAAILAPASMDIVSRAALVGIGLGQAFALAALLLAMQSLLGERVEGLLILAQTALVALAVGGILASLRLLPWLRGLEAGTESWPGWMSTWPPAWFASLAHAPPAGASLPPRLLALVIVVLSPLLPLLAPRAAGARGRSTTTLLRRLLQPARAIATRLWVSRRERGVFDLVFDALPLERDFVLRTYPMVGLPLALLLAGARGESGVEREGLIALLLFTPAVYFPILLAHVPATRSPGARWILDTAPITPREVESAAIKAIAVRFVLPLYLLLSALTWVLAGPGAILRLALPGLLVSLFCLRALYSRIALDPPLSTPADEIEVHHDWMGLAFGIAMVVTILAFLAQRWLVNPSHALLATGVLVGLELLRESTARRRRIT